MSFRRSDRLFTMLLMAPWQGVLAIGAIGIAFDPGTAHEDAGRWIAIAGWLISVVASLWLSSSWMRFVRDGAATSSGSSTGPRRRTSHAGPRSRGAAHGSVRIRALDIRLALVVMPLWRGRAKRTAASLALGFVTTLASATSVWWSALSIAWAYALTALAASCATSALRAATTHELQPLWLASRQLPLATRACEAARLVMMLMPLFVGMLACLAAALHASVRLRPQVVILYATTLVVGCVIEAVTPRAMQPQDHAARWLLMLIAAIAFASEVSAS